MQGDGPKGRKQRASEAFFGRRKGQQLRPGKQHLYETLLPERRLDLETAAPENITALFPQPVERVHLEIGFGGGEHLAHQAELNPNIGHIGVEPFINGMAKMLAQIARRNLENVRLYDDDATRVLDWLPAGSIDQVDLLYPDPWPKKRHWKRRFVNPANLARISRVLKTGGAFRFASDIDTYVNWTLLHADGEPALDWQARTADDWRLPWDGWIRTRYEAKAVREGRAPAYLVFRRR